MTNNKSNLSARQKASSSDPFAAQREARIREGVRDTVARRDAAETKTFKLALFYIGAVVISVAIVITIAIILAVNAG